jgi:hypothetical protein
VKLYQLPPYITDVGAVVAVFIGVLIMMGGGDSLPFMGYFTAQQTDAAGNVYTNVVVSELNYSPRILAALIYMFSTSGLLFLLSIFAERYINYASWDEFERDRIKKGGSNTEAVGRLKAVTLKKGDTPAHDVLLVKTTGGAFKCEPKDIQFKPSVQVRKTMTTIFFLGDGGETVSLNLIDN